MWCKDTAMEHPSFMNAEQIYFHCSPNFLYNICAVQGKVLPSAVDIYKCTLFTGCSSGSPVLTASDDPSSIPWVTVPALFPEFSTQEILTE